MNLGLLLEHIQSKFSVSESLYAMILSYFSDVWKRYPDKIEMIETHNLSMINHDELIVEWMIGKGYFQVRLRENEVRCEAKFGDGSRFGKYHPMPKKMIEVLEQSINKLMAD